MVSSSTSGHHFWVLSTALQRDSGAPVHVQWCNSSMGIFCSIGIGSKNMRLLSLIPNYQLQATPLQPGNFCLVLLQRIGKCRQRVHAGIHDFLWLVCEEQKVIFYTCRSKQDFSGMCCVPGHLAWTGRCSMCFFHLLQSHLVLETPKGTCMLCCRRCYKTDTVMACKQGNTLIGWMIS